MTSQLTSNGIFAIVRMPKEKGDHSEFFVTSPYYDQGQHKKTDSITVNREKWQEEFGPENGTLVMLFGVFGKPKGLRASSARFATPLERQEHLARSKKQ